MSDKELLIQLQKEFDIFKKEMSEIIAALQKENVALKERLAKYENPKNSRKNSVFPSQDSFRKPKNLR